MLHRVGDAAELEAVVAPAAPGPDDEQVGVGRGAEQGLAGVALDSTAVHLDVGREVPQSCFQHLRRLLFVQPGRFAG